MAILQALQSYRYLDRYQLQALFFEGPRSCQYRLAWLRRRGLVAAWRPTIRPGHIRSASVYLLSSPGARALAEWCGEDPAAFVHRAENAVRRNHHLAHDLAAAEFFVGLAAEAARRSSTGLYHWVGEHRVRLSYAEQKGRGPIPDGWGRLILDSRELLLHLEWDRGSEMTRRLHAKLTTYVRFFTGASDAECNHVLFVVPTAERERQVARVAAAVMPRARPRCRVWTATVGRIADDGPLGVVWRDVTVPNLLVSFAGMTARAARKPVEDAICKPGWWERRPGGGEGV